MSCLFRNWCSKCSRMAGEVAKIRLKGTNTRSSTVLPVALKCSVTAFRAPLLISDLWPFSLSAGVWPLEPRYWRASDPVFLIQKRDASICCFFMTKICPKKKIPFLPMNIGPIFVTLSSLYSSLNLNLFTTLVIAGSTKGTRSFNYLTNRIN